MTPADFRAALQRLGMTVRQAADAYGVNKDTISEWRAKGPPPGQRALARMVLALMDAGMSRAEIDALIR